MTSQLNDKQAMTKSNTPNDKGKQTSKTYEYLDHFNGDIDDDKFKDTIKS